MNKELTEKIIRKEERMAEGYSYSYELIERKGRNMADFGVKLLYFFAFAH